MCVDALNEGIDVPQIDGAICLSGVSTELVATQQIGRICRYVEGKKALFINLYTEGTVETSWVSNKTANFLSYWIDDVEQIKD